MRDIELGSVVAPRGWPRARGRSGHRGDAATHERRLLVRVEGESEAHQLLEPARSCRFAVASLRECRSHRLDESRGGRAGCVGAEDQPRRTATTDRVEVDDTEDVRVTLLLRSEVRGAAGAVGTAV